MSAHNQTHANQGEKLLQSLIDSENTWTAKVEEAQKSAADKIAKVQQEATTIIEAAQKKIAELRSQTQKDDEKAATKLHNAVIKAAEGEVKDVQTQSKANQAKAVKLVVDKVLP